MCYSSYNKHRKVNISYMLVLSNPTFRKNVIFEEILLHYIWIKVTVSLKFWSFFDRIKFCWKDIILFSNGRVRHACHETGGNLYILNNSFSEIWGEKSLSFQFSYKNTNTIAFWAPPWLLYKIRHKIVNFPCRTII